MSHLSEFRGQMAQTPGPRKGDINSAWDCYTTASKTAKAYKSVAKSVNRQISYAVDLIAENEERDNPETLSLITNTDWSVYRVSPLWNVQYKKKEKKGGAKANESDFLEGEKPEYDESALKRYAGVIRSFLMKDCSDNMDNPCTVQIKPLKGLRGSRNDKDALQIEVHSVLGSLKRSVFLGILCGIEVSELQISVNDATCLPVFLTNGVVDITDRVIYGLTKCFDCVVSPLLFPKYELLYTAALWTGLASTQNTSDFDCTLQPKRGRRSISGNDETNKENESSKDGKNKNLRDEMMFQYRIPEQYTEIRNKISSLKITLSFPEIKDLWTAIHDPKENTVTEQEMEIFHKVIDNQICRSLGLKVEKLNLESVKLPHISVSHGGRVKIVEESQVKIVLRNLTAMCHGDMLVANPALGVADDSMTMGE